MSDVFNVRKKPASMTDIKDKLQDGPSKNFGEKRVISMTFNMDEDWHRRFKVEASMRGISMKELFEECFRLYEAQSRKG